MPKFTDLRLSQNEQAAICFLISNLTGTATTHIEHKTEANE